MPFLWEFSWTLFSVGATVSLIFSLYLVLSPNLLPHLLTYIIGIVGRYCWQNCLEIGLFPVGLPHINIYNTWFLSFHPPATSSVSSERSLPVFCLGAVDLVASVLGSLCKLSPVFHKVPYFYFQLLQKALRLIKNLSAHAMCQLFCWVPQRIPR